MKKRLVWFRSSNMPGKSVEDCSWLLGQLAEVLRRRASARSYLSNKI